jgi:membrane protease YdiL (CAAX protease family)
MNIMRNFIMQRPFWFALIITIVITLLGLLSFVLGQLLGLPEILLAFAPLLISTIIPLGFIWWLGWWKDTGFVSTTSHVYVLAMVVIIDLILPLIFFGTIEVETRVVVFFLLAFFLTGLSEEALSRGLLSRLFLAKGKWQAVIIPALLFGLGHITHFLSGEYTPVQSVVQISNAFIGGLLYGAVRLRVNNIWPLIILHTFHDVIFGLAGFAGPTATRGLDDISFVFFVIGWVLSIGTVAYIMTQTKLAATVDGQPAG